MKFPILITAVAAALAFAPPARTEEIVTLNTRDGVTQSYLLSVPDSGKPQGAAILFPGGRGAINLRTEGNRVRVGGNNFLTRSRGEFVKRDFATALLDAPSDQASGMSDEFRTSAPHMGDIKAVLTDLNQRFPGVPVVMIGTSRGTVSAAYSAREFGNNVAGVVLTSSLFLIHPKRDSYRPPALGKFDFQAIKAPLLFVHHRDDACSTTPYREAARLVGKYPLISVKGGAPPQSGECEGQSAHGFFGREAPTIDAIANWMLKKPYAREID